MVGCQDVIGPGPSVFLDSSVGRRYIRNRKMVLRGALGGMGGFAVQLAKDAGIMAVAIGKNFAYAKELRAALTVDYYSNERLG